VPVTLRLARSADDRVKIFALRNAVFVDEQRVPSELERDEFDATADHVIVLNEGNIAVGTGRLVVENETRGRVGRMAVHPMWRERGIGKDILEKLEAIAGEKKLAEILLHAQLGSEGFYKKNGYVRAGEPFVEAGIDHVAMKKQL
jgi:predicted GNAT family N-acyltransferase